MKVSSPATKLGCAVFSSSCLAAVIIGFGEASVSAAEFVRVQTTGTLSGTIEFPSINPNYNQSTTRIDTDENGIFYRNGVAVYDSDYVKSKINADNSVSYFVDFLGIPFVSLDGILNSPVLSGGQLTSFNYQNNPGLPGVKFQGVVQDELNLVKALYNGILTDPTTGKKYRGDFQIFGEGLRYSATLGGLTPTVFDFKSDIPGAPTITSLAFNNAPLVKLTITGNNVTEILDPVPASVPESSTIGGLFALGLLGLKLKRKQAIFSRFG